MCQAIPGKVIGLIEGVEPAMARVDFSGAVQKICVACVPDVEIGEYVIVHAGFAISKMNAEEAGETLEIFEEMKQKLDEETRSSGTFDLDG